jgi:hypothetical protein
MQNYRHDYSFVQIYNEYNGKYNLGIIIFNSQTDHCGSGERKYCEQLSCIIRQFLGCLFGVS